MQFNFQLSLISGPRGLPASHWEDYSSQLYCQCWWFCHEVDCHGNWSFGPWMVQPGIAFTLELSLYKYIQKGSKTDYPWQKFLRQSAVNRVKWRGKMVLNDAHKKEKREVAHEKKRAVGSSPSSERNLYHQRKETFCSNGQWIFAEHLLYTKGCADNFIFSISLNYYRQTMRQRMLYSFSFFVGGHTLVACRTLVPQLGTELMPPALEGRFLTIGPQRKSLIF